MTEFRFLHTSDLHLGKRFGNFDEETRADLQQARQSILETLGQTATDARAGHILVAGDMFDTETPSPRIIRQALAAMGEPTQVQWWIIPGNHDSAAAALLWGEMARHAPPNVHILIQPAPVALEAGVVLLPAPCPNRFPGVDLTEWMDSCETDAGHLRIGLAHGGVIDFGSDAANTEVISAKRARTARLDYLALGDWHGVFSLGERTRYSGTPERDRFKHQGRGTCLLVTLTSSGTGAEKAPQVREIEIGKYDWREGELGLSPGGDAVAALRALLPTERSEWRSTLLNIRATGWVSLPERLRLSEAALEIAPEFCHFALNDQLLQTEYSPDDLDEIARSGALRLAAEALESEANDSDLARCERDIASAALNRLYGLIKGAAR